MSTGQKLLLNPEITNDHISMPYPHLRLIDPDDAVALVLPTLPAGDLPVLCTIKGSTRQLYKIRRSAKAIDVLRKVVKLEYVKSKDSSVKLNSAVDILEVI